MSKEVLTFVDIGIKKDKFYTAIKFHFLECIGAANFLSLFNTRNHLGNAAKVEDRKPDFLTALASWIECWSYEQIANCKKFNLSTQTAKVFQRTLKCHVAIIGLLNDNYEFILTARFKVIHWNAGSGKIDK